MGKLDGKVAVITGGASGIGKAAVKLFVKEGAQVVFADIQDDRGNLLAEELGPNAIYVHADVTEEADIKAAIDFAVKTFGRLDIMYNNAGMGGVGGPIEDTPTEAFDYTMKVLFRSVFLGMKHAAPIMKKQKSGSIISTASVAGIMSGYGHHAYSAAKAAIMHLTRTVGVELGESNVRVNCICPGGISTAIFGRGLGFDQEKAERLGELMKIGLADKQPIQRMGLPEDIANAALWLASEDSSYVNGHALVVDGGLTCGRMWSEINEQASEQMKLLGVADMQTAIRKVNEELCGKGKKED